ncbi:hypothetical protein EK904_004311, partial [Melospiza melodia maxima]
PPILCGQQVEAAGHDVCLLWEWIRRPFLHSQTPAPEEVKGSGCSCASWLKSSAQHRSMGIWLSSSEELLFPDLCGISSEQGLGLCPKRFREASGSGVSDPTPSAEVRGSCNAVLVAEQLLGATFLSSGLFFPLRRQPQEWEMQSPESQVQHQRQERTKDKDRAQMPTFLWDVGCHNFALRRAHKIDSLISRGTNNPIKIYRAIPSSI